MAKKAPSPVKAAAGVVARVDALLVAAFLLVFASAMATTGPAGSSSLQDVQARAGKSLPGSGAAESAPRDAVRAVQWSVRALLPKSFGKDFVPVRSVGALAATAAAFALPTLYDGVRGTVSLAFRSRAPPHLI